MAWLMISAWDWVALFWDGNGREHARSVWEESDWSMHRMERDSYDGMMAYGMHCS